METYRNNRHFGNGILTFFAVLGVFLFTVILFVGVFWWYGRDYARVSLNKTYYFLVRDCEDTTASAVAGQIYLSGGAGYLIEADGISSVILSCYFKDTDCERVQSTLSEKGVETRLLKMSTKDFTLERDRTEFRGRVEANAETVETCARILYETANGLERTDISQDEARAAVKGVVTSLKGLRQGNEDEIFTLWNHELSAAERRGKELAEGILFAKDLRYLQIELCMTILSTDTYFG